MIKTSIIKEYLKDPKKNYITFNIKYTNKELEYLDNFNITKAKSFDHYGNIDDFDDKKLDEFLTNIGNNQNINIISNIIHKLLDKITKGYQTKQCWMTIRATLPSNEYDIPRWHKDGNFFNDPDRNASKFITILKGPGTIFIKKSKKLNDIYYKYFIKKRNEYNKNKDDYDEKIENKYRKLYINKFKDFKQNQLKTRDGLIFFTGIHKDKLINGLLHSEPKKDTPRLFISILPGTESEINELEEINFYYNNNY